MGIVENAAPLIKYHDRNGPLREEFYASLGRFFQKFNETDHDLKRACQGFLTSACGGGPDAFSVMHVLTAEMPTRYLLDYSLVIARDQLAYTPSELKAIKNMRRRIDEICNLRNILAHEPSYLSPYTEQPFAFIRQQSQKEVKNFHTIYIGIEALNAASHDIPIAGYLYRSHLSRDEPLNHQTPTWLYKSELLTRERHQDS